MNNNYFLLLDEYLTKSFVNFSLQWHIISNNSTKISNDIDYLSEKSIISKLKKEDWELKNLEKILYDENMNDIFLKMQDIANADIKTDILLKSFVISYFSIFESFIRNISKEMNIEHTQNIEDILDDIWNGLWIKLRWICWEKIYKWFLEFKKRRNLFIHYDGIINQDYLDYIHRYQLDDFLIELFKMDKIDYNLSVWNKLISTPNYFQIIHVKIDTIGFILWILVLENKMEESVFYEQLNKIESLLIMNDKYPLIWTFYSSLKEKIKFNNSTKLNYLYVLFKFKEIYIKKNDRKNIKKIDKDTNKFLEEIDMDSLDTFDKFKYYVLLSKYEQANQILEELLFNEDILYKILDSNIFQKYFDDNVKLIANITKQKDINVTLRRNTSVIGCNNITLLIHTLWKQ